MDRQLKFRAWDELRKVMHYDFQFIKSGEGGNDWIVFTSDKHPLAYDPHPFSCPHFQQQLKISQFTGQQCQGVDVYEGDIFEFDRREWGGEDNTHLVEWDNENAEWSWGGGSTSDMGWRVIIGNKWENPELLEKIK